MQYIMYKCEKKNDRKKSSQWLCSFDNNDAFPVEDPGIYELGGPNRVRENDVRKCSFAHPPTCILVVFMNFLYHFKLKVIES